MAPGAGKVSPEQLRTLMLVERVASALSIVGLLTIVGCFAASRQFRNPIHRLIFINSFYNAFDITATMISLSGPAAGDNSALCQFQGFLMQMFPVADVIWTFLMAVDVYLIVFRRYDAGALRKLEIKYVTVTTVLAFIPAFVFLFIRTPEKGPMYGSVTVGCHPLLLATRCRGPSGLTELSAVVRHRPQLGALPDPDLLRAHLV